MLSTIIALALAENRRHLLRSFLTILGSHRRIGSGHHGDPGRRRDGGRESANLRWAPTSFTSGRARVSGAAAFRPNVEGSGIASAAKQALRHSERIIDH